MRDECLLNIVVAPQVEDNVADWLLGRDEVSGFSTFAVAGHGSSVHSMSLAEQVVGRRGQVLFQVLLPRDGAEALLADIGAEFRGSGMHYWLTPVLASGHIE